MKTVIQIKKIKAVLLYIMQSFPQGVDYIKLFKILYLPSRIILSNTGRYLWKTLSEH